MNSYIIVITILGLAALGMAWMPGITNKIRISYSIIYVLLGVLLYSVLDNLPYPDPTTEPVLSTHITELVVIVSLMGTGLKIDEKFSIKKWKVPLLLVSVTMLLSIACMALLGWKLFGLDIASALLLGAALAPTDPVLASDVQVGPPLEKSKNNVRFYLTAEAGLNDGMAFPFTWLAITIANLSVEGTTIGSWISMDVFYRLGAGAVMGFVIGKGLSYLLFTLPDKNKFVVTREGFVAISATLLVYGLTELIHGYGFIAVFVCAITIRNSEMDHKYHKTLHAFTDQIERILMALVLILIGGNIVHGIIPKLTPALLIFAGVCIFFIRPIAAYLSVWKSDMHIKEKAAVSFFGIKGIGSLFYLSFALQKAKFETDNTLWAIVSMVVLCSILIHGVSASAVMGKIHEQFGEDGEDEDKGDEDDDGRDTK